MKEVSSASPLTKVVALTAAGNSSFAIVIPLLESVVSLDGVCDREGTFDEHRDEGEEFKFSSGISSFTRGLESRDLGVPE